MKPIRAKDLKEEPSTTTCCTEGKDCGCSKGMCPGTLLAGAFLLGCGLWALGS